MMMGIIQAAGLILFGASLLAFVAIRVELRVYRRTNANYRRLVTADYAAATARPPRSMYVRSSDEFTEMQRVAISKRDRFVCQYCLLRCLRRPGNAVARGIYWLLALDLFFNEFDHVLSKFNGGRTTTGNGVCSHKACNRMKGKDVAGVFVPIVIDLVARRQPGELIFEDCIDI